MAQNVTEDRKGQLLVIGRGVFKVGFGIAWSAKRPAIKLGTIRTCIFVLLTLAFSYYTYTMEVLQ